VSAAEPRPTGRPNSSGPAGPAAPGPAAPGPAAPGPGGLPEGSSVELLAVLEEARRLGFLGPGPVEPHVTLARGLQSACAHPPAHALDLGSGGGIPGLVLALAWPASRWVLLDSQLRRTLVLSDAVGRLGLADRVEVRRDRAERAGRDPQLRAGFDLVVARSFGPPALTVECGAPFLRVGGELVVAEPPEPARDRWPPAGLALAGVVLERRGSGPGSWVRLRQETLCPARLPRATGVPAKRPLFPAV
jgi:16S rRNA (guanine527-N7)-methyltransferase